MSRAQRVAVLVGILGVLVAGALLFIPVTAHLSGTGDLYGNKTIHCGAPIGVVTKSRGFVDCHVAARDRVTIAAVVAGVSILGAGAAVWLLAPESESSDARGE